MQQPRRIPSLRRHKPSAQGVVTINGRDVYLGPWPANRRKPPGDVQAKYDGLIAEWLAGGRVGVPAGKGSPERATTVAELLSAFWAHAERHYRKPDGTPTHEVDEFRLSLRPVRHLYADLPAVEFSPLKLKAVRQLMIDGYTHAKYGPQPGLARGVINRRQSRIVRAFKWAVGEELIPVEVYQALKAVRGLERGRTDVRETAPIPPVAVAHVEATIPFLTPPVQALVRLQLLTGMRPGEAVVMRACDIDMSGPVWLYRPDSHKTAHRGKQRIIALGPKAQNTLRPWLKLDTQAYLFSPAEAMAAVRSARGAARKTPLSCGNRRGTNRRKKPKRRPGERYTSCSYGYAVRKGIARADAAARAKAAEEASAAGQEPPGEDVVFVPHWHPHQLRHTHGTEVRRKYGLEAAQVALGHSQANVTEIYAERDLTLAVKVAAEMG